MMSGDPPSRAGRLTALATLAVSAALFLTALFGISSIDPSADAASPARALPPVENISLDPSKTDRRDGDDCPGRDGKRSSGEQRRAQRTS
jgi:hypothetical protein